MKASNFTTTIVVDHSPEEVFNAVNNVRGWWSEEIEGNTQKLNEEWRYHYQDVHVCKLKIVEFVPNEKVVWEVLDNHFSFTKDKEEWKGNTIVFEITEIGDKTQLQFTQVGLVPTYECYDICENAWNTYIHQSLYKLITTGKGEPNGKDKPQTEDEKALSSTNFTSTFFVNQTPAEVFNAIMNVGAWWQGEIKGSTKNLGDEFDYQMNDVHFSRQKLVELIPNEKVVWLVTDSKLSFSNQTEWTGTKIVFEIKEINNKTQVRFTHEGLVPTFECYENCSWAWGALMQESLFSLITTGKGTNVFGAKEN
ncbi:SRPBCC family protein [Pedobacter boryungensis]|uniref:SRPBCC domain-containing protein n=1 Tax=Pedobacter boryungensis TaxID=869962 RepID=A0ABX2DG45_9SPHI|nr:SRPBCC domain-containing protein [Pedobacter boryungensis]NQX32271.1 SRPBCC domain-containing protein [Pedobacter boryungensis]